MAQESIALAEVAHGRSGDKGNHANIAVLAYQEAGFRWLQEILSADAVAQYFKGLEPTRVVRYEAEKLLAFNFVLENVLAGGASRSLRIDTQGKGLASALLAMHLPRPDNLDAMVRKLEGVRK